jgi:hypothetical protein
MFPMSTDPIYMLVIAQQHQESLRRSAEQGQSRSPRTKARARRLSTLLAAARPSWHLPSVLHHAGHSRPA